MEAFQAYLARCPRALVLLEGPVVAWVNHAASELLLTEPRDLVGRELEVVGGIGLHEVAEGPIEVALWAGDGQLLDCAAEVTHLGGATMVELAAVELSMGDDAARALHALAETLEIGVFVSDRGLRLGYVNESLARLLGAGRERLLGAGWVEIFAPEDRPLVRELALRALGGDRVRSVIDVRLVGQRRCILEVSIVPVVASDGRLSFVGTVADAADHPPPKGSRPRRGGLSREHPTRGDRR